MTTLDHPRIPSLAVVQESPNAQRQIASARVDSASTKGQPACEPEDARSRANVPADHPRIGSAYSNEFDRQLRNRVQNIRDLAAEILDIDPSDGEESFAEYQVKAGAIVEEKLAMDSLWASEMYQRLPPSSAGPK